MVSRFGVAVLRGLRLPFSLLLRARLRLIDLAVELLALFVANVAAVASRGCRRRRVAEGNPRLVWGSTPLVNNVYWSRAMREAGWNSRTFVTHFYSISSRGDFDDVLGEMYSWCPSRYRPYLGFIRSISCDDVVFTSFNGFMVQSSRLGRSQAAIFRRAGIKTVVMPFGSDAYVYSRIRSVGTVQGLLLSYPQAAREQDRIAGAVDYWCRNADVVIPGVMGMDGMGRWDVPLPSALSLDLGQWSTKQSYGGGDGRRGSVTICHAPNHRGFKGTEFVIDAIAQLQAEGLDVELLLIEGRPNEEVRRILRDEADVLVEQLIFTGHGINGLEGMASGLPVVCNLEDEQYLLPARRYAFFGECPLVSADPESIVDVLRELVTRPDLRETLGRMGRQYVEKYHGLDSSRHLFGAVLDYLYGRRETLSDLYHPLTSDYVKRSPRIEPPLDKNRLRLAKGDTERR